MHIVSSSIGMDSARTYSSKQTRSQRFIAVVSEDAVSNGDIGTAANTKGSGTFNRLLKVAPSTQSSGEMTMREQLQKIREECMNLLLRLLFPDRALDLQKEGIKDSSINNPGVKSPNAYQIAYQDSYCFEETETTSFDAQGIVNCADGTQISFNMSLNMSRAFCEQYTEEVEYMQVALTDPLVINFDGSVPELSDQTFCFDIDSDGVEDEISKLVAGSGFLAFDADEDGIINNGSELFGAATGNGFRELARFDDDQDGFIDEDDAIFNKLKIMVLNEDGSQTLYSLKDKDIGAIYLGSASTEFSLNDLSTNDTYGKVRSTGFFLFEHGGAGTVQQIDLAKRERALAAYA